VAFKQPDLSPRFLKCPWGFLVWRPISIHSLGSWFANSRVKTRQTCVLKISGSIPYCGAGFCHIVGKVHIIWYQSFGFKASLNYHFILFHCSIYLYINSYFILSLVSDLEKKKKKKKRKEKKKEKQKKRPEICCKF